MPRKVDPLSRRLLMEGVHPMVSDRTGAVTYRARWSAVDPWGIRHNGGKVFKTAEEAEAFLLEMQLAVRRGTYRAPARLTVGEYWAQWFGRMRHQWKGTTLYHADRTWRRHIAPRMAHLPLDWVDRATCQRLVDELVMEGKKGSTIKATLTPLLGMFRAAVRDGLIAESPAAQLVYPDTRSTPKEVWTALQLQRFLAGTHGTELYPLWALLATTGCRIGEALALQWRDVNATAGTLHIRRTLVYSADGKVTVREGTKTDAGRVVPLERVVLDALPPADAPEAWIFARHGRPWHLSTVRDRFGRAITACKLPRITLHGFRHTAATLMFASGVPERTIQAIIGHRSIRTTMDQYTRVDVATMTTGTRALADLVRTTTSDDDAGDGNPIRQNGGRRGT